MSNRQSCEIALYSPDPKGRISGGFLYNAQLLQQLHSWGLPVDIVIDPKDEHNAKVHLVDSLSATAYVQARDDLSKAVFLYHLPPFSGENLPLWWLQTERQLLAETRIIVTGTQALELLQARHRMTQEQMYHLVTVITPGISNHWQRKRQFADLPKELLVIASIVPEKGIEEIVNVLAELATLDWHCRFYGEQNQDGVFYTSMIAKVNDLGLSDRVQFVGTVPRCDINQIMMEADLLLNFSKFETYSMATAEAIATGLPVLSLPVGEVAEFQRASNVQYVSGHSYTEQCLHLQSLLTDSKAYKRLCCAAPFPIKTWADVAQQWQAVFLKAENNKAKSHEIESQNIRTCSSSHESLFVGEKH